MMVTPRSLAFLIIPFLWFGFVFSVTPVIAQFGSEKGLPFVTNYDSRTINATQVWSLIQNDEGIIYAGIQNGFAEYDGVRWRKIVSRVGVGTGGTIRSMAKSDSGLIYYGDFADLGYIGTDSIGNAKCFSMLDYIPTRYRDFFDIWSLYTAPEGIYVQSREYIFLVKPGSKPDTSTTRIWTPQSLFMYAFYMDGDYFVHQQGLGLYKLAGDSLKLVPGSEFLGKERVQTMLAYPAGPNGEKRWLIGMFYSGLYLYNGTTFTPFKTGADRLLQSGGLLYKGIRLRDGTYALASAGNGVALIDSAGNLLQHLDLSSGLQDNNIYGLHQDRAGMLWMALDNGVSRAAIGGSLTLFGKSAGLQGSVLSVGRSGGIIYAGTSRSVFGYNPAGGSFSQVPGTPPNQVFDMLRDDDGMLIPSDGLYAIKDGKGFPIIRSVSGDLSLTAIWRSRHHPGVLLVGGALGVNVFTRQQVPGKKGSVSDWKPLGSIPGIYNQVWSFSEEKDGTMWAGTQSGTVYRLRLHFEGSPVPNLEKTEIETFKREESAVKLIGDVYSIAGTTYFGRDSGLAKYDNAAKEFKQDFSFGTFNTLEEGQTIFLKEDTEGRVWINVGKHSRLAVPKPGGGYDLNDNILSQLSDFNLSYFYPEGNGIVWIGTTDGLLRFDANMVSELSSAFKTLLRHVSVGKSGQLQATPVSVSAPSSFSYQNSSIRFDFSAPFFDQEHKTVYQTRLDGFDKDWSGWDNNHYKEYTNLSPGKYTFRVRAKNIYNTIGEEATYSFLIMAPWYSTPWAYLLYFIIAAAIIYAFVNYRTRQLHARHRELEKEVELRTGELSHRVEELAVINSVQEALVSELDMNGIYELVGEKLREIFNVDVIDIVTYDAKTGLIEDRYANEKGDRTLLPAREPAGFRKYVIETGEVVAINENLAEEGRKFGNEVLIGDVPISGVWVPMTSGSKITGIISLQDLTNEHSFPQGSVNLISTLANSMSVALESARRFDETKTLLKETEQRTAELAVINSVQEGLVREMDIDAIYELVGEKMREIFSAQVIDIVTYDDKTNLISDRYAYEKGDRSLLPPREPAGFRKQLLATGEMILYNTGVAEAIEKMQDKVVIGETPKSVVFYPLKTSGKVNGVISLQNLDHEHAFSDSDIKLLATLSNSMSVALQNARLFDETNSLLKETEQRTAELAVINSVQEGLARELDIQAIYELVGEKMREIFNAQVIDIVTYNSTTRLIEDRYAYEKGDRSLLGPREAGGFRKHVLTTGEMLVHNEKVEEACAAYNNPVLIGEMPKSQVFYPLITGSKVNGVISLQNLDRNHAFSDSDIKLLATLSNSMSVALQNARLFDETNSLLKETEQRTAELAVINSVQEGLARELDIQAIYELVGEKMREIFNAQVIDIVTYNPITRLIEDRYSYEKGDRSLLGPREAGGFRMHVLTTGEMLVHNEKVEEACAAYNNPVLIGEMPKSQVFYPLITGSKVNGVISLQNLDRNHAFSDSDIKLLATLSNSMSVALQNARLFDETNSLLKETEQRNAELAVINSVQDGLVREMDMQGIYELVGEQIREAFDAQVIDIVTYDKKLNLIEDSYSYEKGDRTRIGPREATGFRKHVIETGKPLLINDKMLERAEALGNTVLFGESSKSLIMVPRLAAGEVTGVISLQNLDREQAYTESDIKLLTTLVNSMSVALENARLFDETNRLLKETEQRTAELAVINSVQEGLAKELDMQGIYNLVGDRLCELFPDSHAMVIRTFDYDTGLEHWMYAKEKGEDQDVPPRPFNWNSRLLMETKKSLHIGKDYVAVSVQHGGTGVTAGKPPKSAVFVPMMVGEVVKGSVSLQNVDKENSFTDSDLRLLTTITNSMSVALENARLFDETHRLLHEAKQRANELSTVNSISRALASQLNLDELINLVGDQLRQLFSANIVYLAVLDSKTKIINFPYQYGDNMMPMKMGEGFTSQIIRTQKPLLINKDLQDLRNQLGVEQIGLPAASYLGVPIPVGDEVIGVLSVQSTEHENRFDEQDLRLLSTIAASVGVAMRKAGLFEDLKVAQQEAEVARHTAEKANEAKSAFLSTVSHELRTPLTSVLGFAKIIKKRLEEKVFPLTDISDPKTAKVIGQVSDNLDVVVSEGQRLTHLINDVLDLAKIEAGKMEWNVESVSVAEIAERAIAATTSLFDQNNLELEKDIATDIPTVSGDKDKLIQVMVNLISNAVKFTPAGKVTCSVYQQDQEIVVSISDTGIGIAPGDHSAVFEQFRQVGDTLTDKPKGTGLGLPICKEIVEHHGGRLWMESSLGKGSTFSFALPVTGAEVQQAAPLPVEDLIRQLKEQVAQSKLHLKDKISRVLVVDDDDSIRSLLQQELTEAGYLVEEAGNGKQALAAVRANKPDLIILDIMMPEMNGFDVAAVLKNDPQTMDIPIIVLSIVQDKIRGFRIGVDRYLTKPIDTGLLFNEIGSLLEQGKSKKKVMVVDENTGTVNSLTEVLKARGYIVVESNGNELVENAIASQPDIIIMNSLHADKQHIVKTLRFEKGLENVLFLVYQ